MKKVNKMFTLSVLLSFSSLLWATDNYFSCDTVKGRVSLKIDADHLIYEMKNNTGNYFHYSSLAPSYSGFLYNQYSRFQTNYLTVSFNQSGFKYTVFSNYEDGTSTRGVIVTDMKKNKEYTYNCRGKGIDKLSDLAIKIQCDKDSSLGCRQ